MFFKLLRVSVQNEKGGKNPNSIRTNNAGLELTADILEEIFTSTDFPPNSMELPESLANSGKSRADLWSFASAVAVKWGLDRNNKAGMNNEQGKGTMET